MASLCNMRGEAQPIMAWLNSGVKVKSRSQLKNKLMVGCSGMAFVLTCLFSVLLTAVNNSVWQVKTF